MKIGKRSADSGGKRGSDRFSGKECMAWLCTCKRLRVVEVVHNHRVQSKESQFQYIPEDKKNAFAIALYYIGKYSANINRK